MALQQIKERGASRLRIDRGHIRQAIDRCSNIWASLPALVMVVVWSIRLDSLIRAPKKRRNGQDRDDV